jgi:hypothetical protein
MAWRVLLNGMDGILRKLGYGVDGMKSTFFMAGLAMVFFPFSLGAQSVPNSSGSGNLGGVGVPVARASVAPNYPQGTGGIRYVTRQAPVVHRQQVARQFWTAGGMRLGSRPANGTSANLGNSGKARFSTPATP